MVYKPKKKVTGHKRNDRYTRRRKRAAAAKKRAAAKPVRSNVKRYVAEQFGKTHPDNRYYQTIEVIKPTNKLYDSPRYYPFGATFQNAFLRMEFLRMKEVVSQYPAQYPLMGGIIAPGGIPTPANKIGSFNHWRSLLGRGINMKHSSVYGEIRLNDNIPMSASQILKYGNLKLHMFVLEDKAVTKTEFLNWFKDWYQAKVNVVNTDGVQVSTNQPLSEHSRTSWLASHPNRPSGTMFDRDLTNVPYVAGSEYCHNYANDGTLPTVAGDKAVYRHQDVLDEIDSFNASGDKTEAQIEAHIRSLFNTASGFNEFLVDWRKFYETTGSGGANPEDSLFYNEVKCTTDWDGTRDHSVLPVNKSRFIVHEHKTFSFKPKSNGCMDTVIPFNYTFPQHYMHYDKELLDMAFAYSVTDSTTGNAANNVDANDDFGAHHSWMCPRKQPFMVFVYTLDNPYLTRAPSYALESNRNHGVLNNWHLESGSKLSTIRNQVQHSGVSNEGNSEHGAGAPNHDEDMDGHDDRDDEQIHAAKRSKPGAKVQITETSHAAPHTNPDAKAGARYISRSELVEIARNDFFDIHLHFKCSYENPLATSVVPTINKGRPIIHKRESQPPKRPTRDDLITPKKPKTPRQPSTPRKPIRKPQFDDIVLPPTISPKSAHARDSYYLSKAQQTHNGLYVRGNFLYIYGTRTLADAGIRWPQIAAGNVGIGKFMLTERYKAAEKVLKANPHIKTVVGHSYGATTAYALTRNFRVKGRAYGSPVARIFNDARFQSFRHSGDPVSILDFAAKTSKRPFKGPLDAHSHKFHDGKYKSRSAYLDHDDL
jgi:hypothetical protein